ncbi:MAG: 50S ribosomal protein L30 [Candidatus Bathyarchaeia archaeon]
MDNPGGGSRCLVAVRLRGTARINPELQKTLDSLRLKSKYNAVLLHETSSVKGMLQRAKDHITWGEVDADTILQLLQLRGRTTGNRRIDDGYVKEKFPGYGSMEKLAEAIASWEIPLERLWEAEIKPVFRLHPPKGGFKKTIKRPYGSGGELGYRGPDIKNLIEKMI